MFGGTFALASAAEKMAMKTLFGLKRWQ